MASRKVSEDCLCDESLVKSGSCCERIESRFTPFSFANEPLTSPHLSSLLAIKQENVSNGKQRAGSAKAAAADLHGETLVTQPKPARSAFMCFSDAKEKEFTSNGATKKKELIRRVAEAWRNLTPKVRYNSNQHDAIHSLSIQHKHMFSFYRNVPFGTKKRGTINCGKTLALFSFTTISNPFCFTHHLHCDCRFMQQKSAYKGPWEAPKRRAKKHPLAPKRPMSAFLKYSQHMRKFVKEQNPDMANTDVSRLLGEMWRNATPLEKRPYVETEKRERAVYKKDIARFREEQAKKDAESRTSHESVQRMREQPVQANDEAHPNAEDADAASNQHARFYEAYHPEQIAPVASSDSHSLHELRAPQYDPYFGPQYSSRRHPPVGTGKFRALQCRRSTTRIDSNLLFFSDSHLFSLLRRRAPSVESRKVL